MTEAITQERISGGIRSVTMRSIPSHRVPESLPILEDVGVATNQKNEVWELESDVSYWNDRAHAH